MLFWKKGKVRHKNLREYLEDVSREIEVSGWIATAIFSYDGLKIFSKTKNNNYQVERVYPYAVKLFQTALKFHEKASPGLKVGGFEPPRVLFYQMETRESVFIVKGFSKKDIFLIYIIDPELSGSYSTDRTLKKLTSWLYKVSKEFDRLVFKEK